MVLPLAIVSASRTLPQYTTDLAAKPAHPAQDAMEHLKLLFLAQSHDAQTGSKRTLAERKNGTDQQNLNLFPGLLTKQQFKEAQHMHNLRWQVQHSLTRSCWIR